MKLEVVPRFRIDGKYYTMEELPEDKVKEIVMERIDMAMKALKFEKKRATDGFVKLLNGSPLKEGRPKRSLLRI